ncbi:MAG: DUF4013 domain-containing protein [Planctomycetes bacterium]|nr:DUF4013 domain-containing protein [Planctomycetota bacterium]
MITLDWRSAALACTADPAWRRRIFRGGLLLMIPFVGWPIVLGYRRLFAEHLLDRTRPLLPVWHGNTRRALLHGLGAMGVIHGYFLPIYAWMALRTTEWQLWSALPWIWIFLFVAAFPIFSTLIVPAWLCWLRLSAIIDVDIPTIELALVGMLFAAITFMIPAGFLTVSQTRRTMSAFDLGRSLALIKRAPRRYTEAWIGSGILSLAAHACLPLAPWSVFWCYLAIIHCFNEVPLADESDPSAGQRSWFGYFRDAHWTRYRISTGSFVESFTLEDKGAGPLGSPAPRIRALRLGPLRFLCP